MRVYFVRHGESELNAVNIHQSPHTILSKRGIQQAKTVVKRFEKISIDLIITSEYKRAQETAKYIAQKLQKPIIISPLFVERRRPSEIVGKSIDDPEVVKIRQLLHKNADNVDWRYSNEENFFDLIERGKKAIHFIEEQKVDHLLIVSHGGFIKLLIALFLFEDALTADMYNALYHKSKIDNTGITVFETDHHRLNDYSWKLVTLNDRIHVT
ncbi:MAG: histidine phosphatase family protein [Patescibacteria group bacterium]